MVRRMALPKAAGPGMRPLRALRAAALLLAAGLGPVLAEEAAPKPPIVSPPASAGGTGAEPPDPSLSPECRVPGSKLYTLAKLRAVKAALKENRPVRVLAVGSTSAGPGASATYPM